MEWSTKAGLRKLQNLFIEELWSPLQHIVVPTHKLTKKQQTNKQKLHATEMDLLRRSCHLWPKINIFLFYSIYFKIFVCFLSLIVLQ